MNNSQNVMEEEWRPVSSLEVERSWLQLAGQLIQSRIVIRSEIGVLEPRVKLSLVDKEFTAVGR